MQNKIRRLYLTDCFTVMLFLVLFWAIIVFVAFNVVTLTITTLIRSIIISTTALIIAFGTSSSLAVLAHLKKNQQEVYLQEITSQQNQHPS